MNFIIAAQISLAVILLFMINPATAGGILKVIEMAQSAKSIEFSAKRPEMFPETIARTGNPRKPSK